MINVLLCAAFALFLWWFSTGVLLYLNHQCGDRVGVLMAGAVLFAVAAMGGIAATVNEATPAGAVIAFSCALALWGAVEMSYYLGCVTGTHALPCPPRVSEFRRFTLALSASIYHELTVVGVAAAVALVTWRADNQVGLWTFVVLWLMRWSSKLNLFLGVPNFHEDWLPPRIRYIASYVSRRPMNLLFPISVTASTVLGVMLLDTALAAGVTPFEQTALVLVAALLALAVLEHWFLVLPVADAALWKWALKEERQADFVDLRAAPPLLATGSAAVRRDETDS